MLERNKKPIYHCRRLTPADPEFVEGMELFAPPVLRYLNYKSVSGEATLETVGEVNSKNLIAKLLYGGETYTENDRCYVNVKPPVEHDMFCNDADYRVSSVLPVNRVVEVILEKVMTE